jgi:cytochrome c2
MNLKFILLSVSFTIWLWACNSGSKNAQNQDSNPTTTTEEAKLSDLALKGEQIFQANCMQCHLMKNEAALGPGMVGVTKRVPSKEWTIKFIQNSQAVIKSGDKYAVALFEKYSKALMPSFSLSGDELNALWQYLEEAGK